MQAVHHGRIATLIAATAALWVVGAIGLEGHLTLPSHREGYWNRVGQTLPVPLVLAALLGNLWEHRRQKNALPSAETH